VACQSYGQEEPAAAGTSFPVLCCLAMPACSGAAVVHGGRHAPAAGEGRWGKGRSIRRGGLSASGWSHASDPRDAFPQDAVSPETPRSASQLSRPHEKGQMMPVSPYLAVTTCHRGRQSVLRLQGELDVCTRDRLRRAISSALRHSPQLLVLDLSALGFMDCSGLSVLVWAHQRLAEQDCRLLITGAQPIVQRLIHLTGLDTHLQLSAAPCCTRAKDAPNWWI
jgi:anti-anti-sigma factor